MILRLKVAEVLKTCSVISLDLYSKRVGQVYQSIFTNLMNSFEAGNKKIHVMDNTYIYIELTEDETTALTKYLQEKIDAFRKAGADEGILAELKNVLNETIKPIQ